MSATILNTVQYANQNLRDLRRSGIANITVIGTQVNIATVLLEKGYDINTEVEPLLAKYGKLENIPANNQINP